MQGGAVAAQQSRTESARRRGSCRRRAGTGRDGGDAGEATSLPVKQPARLGHVSISPLLAGLTLNETQ